MSKIKSVVVTGASGFVGKHVIAQLLEAGFAVRGTLRSQAKIAQVRQSISEMVGKTEFQRFSLTTCDLLNDAGWAEAMLGAEAVIHVATVVPAKEPKDRDEVLRPAIEGTERVLKFAKQAKISRMIMTSSIAAIGYGVNNSKGVVKFTADDWTSVEGLKGSWTYPEAKVRAEKLAWETAKRDGLNLTTVCPSMIFGPAPDTDLSPSLEAVRMVLAEKAPALPPGGFCVVDVRDVAHIHVAALLNPSSVGRRVIAAGDYVEFLDIAGILGENYPEIKTPTRTAPLWLLKFMGRFDRSVRQIAADLDTARIYDGSYGAELMGREYRSPEEATLSAAESLYELGIVTHPHS